jgi:hypothetical protein
MEERPEICGNPEPPIVGRWGPLIGRDAACSRLGCSAPQREWLELELETDRRAEAGGLPVLDPTTTARC